MAAVPMEDDEAWLYGDANQEGKGKDKVENQETSSNNEQIAEDVTEKPESKGDEEPVQVIDVDAEVKIIDKEAGELSGEEEAAAAAAAAAAALAENDQEEDSEDSDSDDDDVQVTIGDIKSSPGYGYGATPVNLNIKRGGAYPGGATQTPGIGKSKGIDLDSIGSINGVPAYEFNLDTMEDKPWRKPGADITDYFNYGFNEDTWRGYCDKQRKIRMEIAPSSVKMATHNTINNKDQQIPVASVNENSKYAGSAVKKAGPPPGRKLAGAIDVIGGTTTTSRRPVLTPPKENVIQVMTADKRDYVRKPFGEGPMPPPSTTPALPTHMVPPGFIPPDLSVPPPGMPPPPGIPPPGLPPPGLPPPPAGLLPGYSDHFGAYPRFPVPPPSVVPPQTDRSQSSNFDGHSSFFSSTIPSSYNPFDSTSDVQWEPRDRPGSSFSSNWEFHERSSERSPQRSPGGGGGGGGGGEEELERRHGERHRDRDRERSRDKDRERERDRDRERTERSHDRERSRDGGERDRERERVDRERPEREYDYDERRDRDRDRRHRDRDRDRDRDRERDRERDRDKEHRSSRRKHREEEEAEHRSSRHKRKRSKRDKDDESSAGGDTQEKTATAESTTEPVAPSTEEEKPE